MEPEISNLYGNKIRVRVCGLCWQDDRLLVINHKGLSSGDFWAPPGGGLEFGEPVHDRLRQEFLEETGLQIAVGQFRFACEFIERPLHAIELFFDVTRVGGRLIKGEDPELPIIGDARFMSPPELAEIPIGSLHGIFRLVPSALQLKTLAGFFTI